MGRVQQSNLNSASATGPLKYKDTEQWRKGQALTTGSNALHLSLSVLGVHQSAGWCHSGDHSEGTSFWNTKSQLVKFEASNCERICYCLRTLCDCSTVYTKEVLACGFTLKKLKNNNKINKREGERQGGERGSESTCMCVHKHTHT